MEQNDSCLGAASTITGSEWCIVLCVCVCVWCAGIKWLLRAVSPQAVSIGCGFGQELADDSSSACIINEAFSINRPEPLAAQLKRPRDREWNIHIHHTWQLSYLTATACGDPSSCEALNHRWDCTSAGGMASFILITFLSAVAPSLSAQCPDLKSLRMVLGMDW